MFATNLPLLFVDPRLFFNHRREKELSLNQTQKERTNHEEPAPVHHYDPHIRSLRYDPVQPDPFRANVCHRLRAPIRTYNTI